MISYANYSGSTFKSSTSYWCTFKDNTLKVAYKMENTNSTYSPKAYHIVVGDFIGSNRSEFLQYGYGLRTLNTSITWRRISRTGKYPPEYGRIKSFADGFDKKISVEYAYLIENGIYEKENNSTYPLADYIGPLSVVKSVTAGNENVSYKYKGGKIHLQGNGFMGFTEITKTDRKYITHTTSRVNTTWYTPEVTQEKLTTKDSSLMSQTNYTNRFTQLTGKRFQLQAEKATLTDYLKGITQTTEYSNYEYGIPKTVKKIYRNDLTETTTSTLRHITTGGKWILGLPLTIDVKKESGGSSWLERTTNTYSSDNRLEQTVLYSGTTSNKVLTKKFRYDEFGHIKEESTINYNSTDELKITYEYSTNGRYLLSTTDPTGLIAKSSYNTLGQLSTSTDYLGNITRYEYNPIDRLKEIRYPDGTIETISIERDYSILLPGGSELAVYKVTHNQTGKPTQINYYDKYGIESKKTTIRFDGTRMNVNEVYQPESDRTLTYHPYTDNNFENLYMTHTRDKFGRLEQSSSKLRTNRTDTYQYQGNSVTSKVDDITITKTYDAAGRLTRSSDHNGEVIYYLRPDGQPTQIKVTGGNSISFTYDSYGRQITVNNPSLGLTTYTYDQWGNIATEKNAKGETITYTYDKYGKLQKKQYRA
ncbi:MAG: hypothetical protein LUD15_11290 [Bacteroides sp.]|nr:hypothetical protein [Bacteroides sp.]